MSMSNRHRTVNTQPFSDRHWTLYHRTEDWDFGMTFIRNTISALAVCTAIFGFGCAQTASAACINPPGFMSVETQPVQLQDPNWQAKLNELEASVALADLSRVRTVFIGDSITEAWPPELFQHFYGTRAALNLGVRGDNTQGLLWRIPRMPLGTRLKPQTVVLLIGTNDLWTGAVPSNIAAGVSEVLVALRQRLPTAKILLIELLPRGVEPSDPLRAIITATNKLLDACAAPGIEVVNPGPLLLDGRGFLTNDVAYDGLHPSWLGYSMLGTAIEPTMKRLIGD